MRLLTLTAIITGTFLFGNGVYATGRVADRPPSVCTRDFNPWGNPSHCVCAPGLQYSFQTRLCLKGSPKMVALQGKLLARVAAIGAETTGVVLVTDGGNFELVLPLATIEAMEAIDGKEIAVEGEVISVPGVELAMRTLLVVESWGEIE